jgi:hypothetical protein
MGHYDKQYEAMYDEQRKQKQITKNKAIPELLDHLNEAPRID